MKFESQKIIMNTLRLLFGRETASNITGDDFLKLIGREELMISQQPLMTDGRRKSSARIHQLPPIGEKVIMNYNSSKDDQISFRLALNCIEF